MTRVLYLILPWDGDTPCYKLVVEVIICRVQIYTFDCRKLLYVQNILAVHRTWLKKEKEADMTNIHLEILYV